MKMYIRRLQLEFESEGSTLKEYSPVAIAMESKILLEILGYFQPTNYDWAALYWMKPQFEDLTEEEGLRYWNFCHIISNLKSSENKPKINFRPNKHELLQVVNQKLTKSIPKVNQN